MTPSVCLFGQTQGIPPGQFLPGSVNQIEDLPPGQFRSQLQILPVEAQNRALQWLNGFHFTERDLPSLRADENGGIFYVCGLAVQSIPSTSESPAIGAAAVPVSPFPASLVFHSRQGSPNVLYLNFTGETVSNTEWNNVVGRTEIPAVAFSTDSDLSTFSDAEQIAIKRIWQRVAEDYAPFDIDVTTERPSTFNNRTAHALITRTTDANGAANPYSTAGGVGYVNVFGSVSYSKYRPAWIYHNNLANTESYIAEAASHEIGHNMGLSHDGKTDGTEYYGGHGGGDTSWGPLMGTGYNRNVSQWCKGDYYLANNTEDDLATIAGKISYRTDDHGNTPGTATALVFTGGTNVVSTTPENDPDNTNTDNKGVIERNADLDVFSFVTGTGPVQLNVNPWIMPSGTRGGNLDVRVQLYDEGGNLLLTNNPANQTTALIDTNLAEGRYYVHVRNSATGEPFSSTPTGYTSYGSIGQYFISGYITASTGYVVPPVAELQITDLNQAGQSAEQFTVTYSDDVAVDTSTLDSNDLLITGTNGYDHLVRFISVDLAGNGTPRVATYAADPPNGNVWTPSDNGTYTVWMQTNQVDDAEGAWVAGAQLGQFKVTVPVTIYLANMSANPGWTLDPQREYGSPSYSSSGPTTAFIGTNIIGYNLAGDYPKRLSATYATTPPIDCSGSTTLTLRFQRWLRLKNNDTASIEVSSNGMDWLAVWSTSRGTSDSSWQSVQYTLPAGVAGSPTVQIRWGIESNPDPQTDIGWNLDDVEILGDGALDVTSPVASLSVANITFAGSPSHSCSVTYTDDTAVRQSSLDSTDLVVTGPSGYSNLVEFVGSDLSTDGSPMTGTYSIPAPAGSWEAADNGTYVIMLQEAAVEDTLNNSTPQAVLGSFDVAISTASPGILEISPAGGLTSSGTVGGPFNPSSIIYTLTNSGGSTLNWTADATANWLTLSATGGTLDAGASTRFIVSFNSNADCLPAGSYGDAVAFQNSSTGNGNTSRSVSLEVAAPQTYKLNVTINNPAWGTASPTNGTYPAGSSVEITAAPAAYYQFMQWSGDAVGTNDPLTLVINTNLSVQAVFGELLTTNYPTPYWWLASYGYTNNLESAVTNVGANRMQLWQSYIAGLDPTNADSQLRLTLEPANPTLLSWQTVSGRVYSIHWATNDLTTFAPLDGATNLPWTITSITNNTPATLPRVLYRLEVEKP